MTTQEIYEKIAQIALNAKGPMTFRQLNEKLGNIDSSGRGTASRLRGAYNYFKVKEGGVGEITERIARTFTDDNGNYAFQ